MAWCTSLNWTRVTSPGASKITGFVVDGITPERKSNRSGFRNIGVTEETPPAGQDAIRRPQYPRFEIQNAMDSFSRKPEETDLFMSTASLHNVAEIAVQISPSGERPFGLQVTHYDGSIDTLGEWDPERTDITSTLYTSTDGMLEELIFTFTRIPARIESENENSDSDEDYSLRARVSMVSVETCEYQNQDTVGPCVIVRSDDDSVYLVDFFAGGPNTVGHPLSVLISRSLTDESLSRWSLSTSHSWTRGMRRASITRCGAMTRIRRRVLQLKRAVPRNLKVWSRVV